MLWLLVLSLNLHAEPQWLLEALQKIDAESDKLIESFEMDTNNQFSFFHNSLKKYYIL